MKKVLVLLLPAMLALTACDQGMSQREKECLAATGNIRCESEADQQIRAMNAQAEIMDEQADLQEAQAQVQYPDVAPPGSYTNHYGDPRYGQWDQNGVFQFFDPFGEAAMSTNSFLLGAGLGGLTAYMLSRDSHHDSWKRKYGNSYKPYTSTYSGYTDRKGKPISAAEYNKRKAQSNFDKQKNKYAKLKAQYNQKQQAYKAKPGQPPKDWPKNKPFRQSQPVKAPVDVKKNQPGFNKQTPQATKPLGGFNKPVSKFQTSNQAPKKQAPVFKSSTFKSGKRR